MKRNFPSLFLIAGLLIALTAVVSCYQIRPLPTGAAFAALSPFDGLQAGKGRQIAGIPFRWAPAGVFTVGSPPGGPDIKASLGQEFILPIGQSAEIAGEDLTVRFIEVTGDSRSPKGAETIWAGEAKCRIQVSYQGATSEITLTEKGGSEGYTLVPVLQINLNFQLQPYPEVGKQPANSDYTLRLKITK